MKAYFTVTVFTLILIIFFSCHAKLTQQQKSEMISVAEIEGAYATHEKPIWSDEFEIEGLPDTTKWSYQIGDGCPTLCGWGNNELQYYTEANSQNIRIENGTLIIEAHKQATESRAFSSAKLVSRHKGEWKYGYIEVRAKLPSGRGTWPAIWMMPTKNNYGSWPKSGEIDIMEHVGYSPDSIFGTVHTEAYNHILDTQSSGSAYKPAAESTFKTYAIDWTEDKIDFIIDDEIYHTFKNKKMTSAEWPFDQKFYLILNLAVGGNWGGKHGVDETIWPQKMEIDFVKVYTKT